MSTRAKLIALAIGAAVTVLFALAIWPDREPSYQGKSLSYWVGSFSNANSPIPGWASAAQTEMARNAIRHIGTNGIPLLIEWVSYDGRRRRNWLTRLPMGLGRTRLLQHMCSDPRKEVRAGEAAKALITLGPEASPAFPELGRILTDGEFWGAGTTALSILREIGEPAVPTLVFTMTNKPSRMREVIVMNLNQMGPKASAAVPALKSLLQDPQPRLRFMCIQAIENITREPFPNIPPSQAGQ
jgi:hypothetical protein